MKTKLLFLIVLALVVFAILNLDVSQDIRLWIKNNTNEATFWVLFATLVVLYFYTKATQEIARKTEESNTFDAVTRIHERMTNIVSYENRGYLYKKFNSCFEDAKNQLENLPANLQTVDKFNEILDPVDRKAVEMTLSDFDIITLPYFLEIEAVKKLAIAYKSVLKNTAKHIVPFVMLHTKLREGEKYKLPYLYLIKELGDILSEEQIEELKLIERNPEEILAG